MSSYEASMRPAYAVAESQSVLLRSIFGWMTVGLLVTGAVSAYVLNTPSIAQAILGSSGLFLGLFIVEIFIVGWLSLRINKMSAAKATGLFLLYSALNGITLAPIAFAYTSASIASTFMVAGGLFAVMALYGYATKRDLTSMGSFLMMGLIGVLIAALVNIFLLNDMLSFVISVVGVIVFTGLTAWDVQKFKQLGSGVTADTPEFRRVAIAGALTLYLDLINLFLMLLRLIGNRD